jgi:type IX secretion system PorP/SprF family membrane protein
LYINNETFGVTQRTGTYFSYSYKVKLRSRTGGVNNKGRGQGFGTLALGLSGGFDLRNSKWSEVTSSDPVVVDPEFAYNSGTLFEPNFGFGLFYFSEKYYGGFSAPRILQYSDNQSENSTVLTARVTEISYYLNGGALFYLSNRVKIRPSVLLKWIPRGTFQADINANFIFLDDRLTFGLTYRTTKTGIVLIQFYPIRQFSIGYSYEYSFNQLVGFSSGTHEVMLQYEFGFNVKTTNPRYF